MRNKVDVGTERRAGEDTFGPVGMASVDETEIDTLRDRWDILVVRYDNHMPAGLHSPFVTSKKWPRTSANLFSRTLYPSPSLSSSSFIPPTNKDVNGGKNGFTGRAVSPSFEMPPDSGAVPIDTGALALSFF